LVWEWVIEQLADETNHEIYFLLPCLK